MFLGSDRAGEVDAGRGEPRPYKRKERRTLKGRPSRLPSLIRASRVRKGAAAGAAPKPRTQVQNRTWGTRARAKAHFFGPFQRA